MSRARIAILTLAFLGLVTSSWSARPEDPTSIPVWGFAVVWASAAWLILCILVTRGLPTPAAMGALLALAVSEIVLHAKGIHRDGLFAAIKPIYELPAGLVGALVAAWFSRMGQQDA